MLTQRDEFKDAPEAERIVMLRLLHVQGINLESADAIISAAHKQIGKDAMRVLMESRGDIFELHRAGELVGAMLAGQAFWEQVNHLNTWFVTRKARLAGIGTIKGGKKGAQRPRSSPKRDSIIKAAQTYKGPATARARTIAHRTGASEQHVRKVLKKA
jgi:hypothetical protein